jgi:hypothetical protein
MIKVSNITLAWMMDQLSSIGVTFKEDVIDEIYKETRAYYNSTPKPKPGLFSCRDGNKPWANEKVFDIYEPVRPYALGQIYESDMGIWLIAGAKTRTPGLYTRSDADTGQPTDVPLQSTNERIHSSVRARLDLGGLGPDDVGPYKCPALLKKGPWELRQVKEGSFDSFDSVTHDGSWIVATNEIGSEAIRSSGFRWVWEYVGPKDKAPVVTTLPEDELGPIERRLLEMDASMYGKVAGSPEV